MPSSIKKSIRDSGKSNAVSDPSKFLNPLKHLLRAGRPTDYREALLELFHTYIIREHEALPLDFANMAQRIHLLCEFFKELDQYDPEKLQGKT